MQPNTSRLAWNALGRARWDETQVYWTRGDGRALSFFQQSVWKWSHYAFTEAIEPFKLHPTSMSFKYKVLEHLKQLWMEIWRHIHSVTTTEVSPELGELAEILDDVNDKTIRIRYHWGCRTFQTASHIHVIHILDVWTSKTVVDEDMAAYSHRYHHRGFPRFGRVYCNPRWCQCGNDPSTLSLRM